ncbi:MAG: hypothetical protein ACRC4L_03845, partial [Mycoplasma sp.]
DRNIEIMEIDELKEYLEQLNWRKEELESYISSIKNWSYQFGAKRPAVVKSTDVEEKPNSLQNRKPTGISRPGMSRPMGATNHNRPMPSNSNPGIRRPAMAFPKK